MLTQTRRTYSFIFLISIFHLFDSSTWAAQRGPIIPSHRYPTDRSFHLSYDLSFFSSASNFVEALTTEPLEQNARLNIFRHSFATEFQPNRQLSLGARFNIDSVKLSTLAAEDSQSKMAFSDQSVFGEFRFFDQPGASLGAAVVAKFPFYTNPSLESIIQSGEGSAALLGDAQTDLSFLITAEFWPSSSLRTQFDLGYTYRTEGFSAEIPYSFSIGFVSPKIDLALKAKGNFSIANDSVGSNEEGNSLKQAFAGSDYALAINPWTFNLEPSVDVWISNKIALTFLSSFSIAGSHSPYFQLFQIGLIYRFAERVTQNKRSFKQVDFSTDQESGKFQGEAQTQSVEPRRPQPKRIEEISPDEEFQ